MRSVGRMVADILHQLKEKAVPGVSTLELDRLAEKQCKVWKVQPAFKGYGGFPFSICASPNNRVVHGFSDKVPLLEGDILSIDFGIFADGFYGDSAITVPIGTVDDETQRLLDVTEASLECGIAKSVVDGHLSDIGHAIQSRVEGEGFSIVRDFVGHGIGRELHEDPQIPNYGKPGRGVKLKSGMTLAIEPMVNIGSPGVKVLEDGWTAVTVDGQRSAHFEHTVAVTENGPEILTCL
jgi:methionyl aminopeptidase